jgi:hypothetical protein
MKNCFLLLFVANISLAQTWLQLSDMPGTERDDGVGAVINNKAYFGTGLRQGSGVGGDLYSMDLGTNTWSTLTAMPAGSERQYAVAFTYSNYLFIHGGWDASNAFLNDTYRYDIASNTWTTVASKPGAGVIGAISFTLGSKAYVVGGRYGNDPQVSDEVWEYDMSSNIWTQKNNFPFGGRWRACATTFSNTGYFMLGKDSNGSYRKEVYKYSQGTDSWVKIADFNQPKSRYYSALQSLNNKMVLFAGIDTLNDYYKECWFFDETNGFVAGPVFPSTARKGGMSCSANNKFYYSCGIDAGGRLRQTWMLDVPLGMEEKDAEKSNYLIYPNPCKETLYLRCQKNTNATAELFNITGELIVKANIDSTERLDMSRLASGIYMLKISSGGSTELKKVIKE